MDAHFWQPVGETKASVILSHLIIQTCFMQHSRSPDKFFLSPVWDHMPLLPSPIYNFR